MRRRADEDWTKLPKWAQSRLRVLEANYESLRERLAAMDAGQTDTWMERSQEKIHLPQGVAITFRTRHGEIQCRVLGESEMNGEAGVLYVNSGGRIVIRPQVSNAIDLTVERG